MNNTNSQRYKKNLKRNQRINLLCYKRNKKEQKNDNF